MAWSFEAASPLIVICKVKNYLLKHLIKLAAFILCVIMCHYMWDNQDSFEQNRKQSGKNLQEDN